MQRRSICLKKISKLFFVSLLVVFCFNISANAANIKSSIPKNAVRNGNHYYLIVNERNLTWEEAKALCEAQNGHLATITSKSEQNFINKLNKKEIRLWIGGYRDNDGSWKWITGEKWKYTNWGVGEPNNSSNVVSNEKCVAVWPQKWNDMANNNIYEQSGYICEWDLGTPKKPSVTKISKKNKTVTGKSTAGTTVYVKIGKKTYKTTANTKGVYKVKCKTLKKGVTIKVYAQNSNGGKSSTLTKKVK